jgi:hypothetical protein
MIPVTITIKVAGPPRVAPMIETGRTYEWVQVDKEACDPDSCLVPEILME